MSSSFLRAFGELRETAAAGVAAARAGRAVVRVYGAPSRPEEAAAVRDALEKLFSGALFEECPSPGLPTLEPLAECGSAGGGPVLLYSAGEGAGFRELEGGWEHPFFAGQTPLLTGGFRSAVSGSIASALAAGAFALIPGILEAAEADRESAAASLAGEIGTARIRGRGGSGYPAVRKWERFLGTHPRGEAGKLLVCNGDEGNPGAYMDRLLLEGDPWAVMEGMLAAALVSGADRGVIYLRGEYRQLYRSLLAACREAERHGLLGASILGSGRSFRLEPVLGAGAYICGEETALVRSLEGELPEPSGRPPYPAERGYGGAPTLVHNVETWASITAALRMGAGGYAEIGTPASGGTKLLSFSGDTAVPGLAEVPFGTPVGEVLRLFSTLPGADGSPAGRPAALQFGGPSGGFLTADRYETPVDYEPLAAAGAPLGSGGVVALGSGDSVLPVIRHMLAFSAEESCGKCAPCREGLPLLLRALDRCMATEQEPEAEVRLLDAALCIGDGSFCGLGRGAVVPLVRYLEGRGVSVPGRDGGPGEPVLLPVSSPGDDGRTLLNLLRERGWDLPALCAHRDLPPRGACRCCLVETGGEVRSSCDYLPSDGETEVVVYPASPRAVRARRFALLLSAAHDLSALPLSVELEEAGIDLSRKETLFPGEILVSGNAGETETRRCILCGRCVAACSLVPERNVLCFSGRGTGKAVSTAFNLPDDLCIGCGACAFVCPVDAVRIEQR